MCLNYLLSIKFHLEGIWANSESNRQQFHNTETVNNWIQKILIINFGTAYSTLKSADLMTVMSVYNEPAFSDLSFSEPIYIKSTNKGIIKPVRLFEKICMCKRVQRLIKSH